MIGDRAGSDAALRIGSFEREQLPSTREVGTASGACTKSLRSKLINRSINRVRPTKCRCDDNGEMEQLDEDVGYNFSINVKQVLHIYFVKPVFPSCYNTHNYPWTVTTLVVRVVLISISVLVVKLVTVAYPTP